MKFRTPVPHAQGVPWAVTLRMPTHQEDSASMAAGICLYERGVVDGGEVWGCRREVGV